MIIRTKQGKDVEIEFLQFQFIKFMEDDRILALDQKGDFYIGKLEREDFEDPNDLYIEWIKLEATLVK